MSTLLNTGLDKESLRILVNLCEAGVNPEALASGAFVILMVVVVVVVATHADGPLVIHVLFFCSYNQYSRAGAAEGGGQGPAGAAATDAAAAPGPEVQLRRGPGWGKCEAELGS